MVKPAAAPVKIELGRRIRYLRRTRALTQEALAERAGVHPTYLAGIERGERNPALENLHAIATALGVKLAELFMFERQPGMAQ
ncbi:MAG TPA: helix-turn-helix transcriptional regulator [bacterium]|jgi:transcriptional regulator with XRE-family HTH domain|nr:helix-turn-helix transcriptional regulator [bacterium]